MLIKFLPRNSKMMQFSHWLWLTACPKHFFFEFPHLSNILGFIDKIIQVKCIDGVMKKIIPPN